MLLEVDKIITLYGLSLALDGVSLAVDQGEVVALLGRNGAGKTTTLKSIMGLVPPKSGRVRFQGQDIAGKPPFHVAQRGIGYVPDDRRLFPDLTVEENLLITRRVQPRRPLRWKIEDIYTVFPRLLQMRRRLAVNLSGGEQKMLAIGRALMGNPDLLLLDEPSEGLSPLAVQLLVGAVEWIRDGGVSILIADQNLRFCRKVASRGYIIDRGVIRHDGTLDVIWRNEEIVRQYLAV